MYVCDVCRYMYRCILCVCVCNMGVYVFGVWCVCACVLYVCTVASEAYHDWSGKAAGARLRVNFTLKLLLSQNFCNWPLMKFISFASNIGPAAVVPAGPAPAPLVYIVCTTLVPRPLPDFVAHLWRKIGRRPGIKTTSQTGNGGLG